MVVEQCHNCKFYDHDEYENDGISYVRQFGACRRYPPKRVDTAMSGFPLVEGDWWCGEHQKKFAKNDK